MLTTRDFQDLLSQWHLLEPEQLQALALDPELTSLDSRAMARELIQREWLTPYQVNQLFQGKGAELVLGSYLLLERLGEGGMGQVFKARNWKLHRTVALKLIRKERLDSPDTIRRFQREILAASQLAHPNIVHAIDAEEVNGTWFLVMEHIDGNDLKQILKQKGRLSVAESCDYIRQAALGLQHACDQRMVHRDIKPSNLLITQPLADYPLGQIKILDLGLARLPSDQSEVSTLTVEGTIMGTPDYLAPEQGEDSHKVDIRADIYSLGCTLYHFLTGAPPFPGGSFAQKIRKHLTAEPKSLSVFRTDVPKPVEQALLRMMEKDPNRRYQQPHEVAQQMATAFLPRARPMPPTPAPPANPFSDLESTTKEAGRSTEASRSARKPLLVLGAAMILGALALLPLVLRNSPANRNGSTQPGAVLTQREKAEKRFAELLTQARQPTPPKQLYQDLLAFRRQNSHYPDLCLRSAILLRDNAFSPLDQLSASESLPLKLTKGGVKDCAIAQVLGDPSWCSPNGIWTMEVSPNGSQIACGTFSGAHLWDAGTGRILAHLSPVKKRARALAYSPTENILATGSDDHVVRLWDLKGNLIHTFPDEPAPVQDLELSPNGKLLVAVGSSRKEGYIHIYDAQGRKEIAFRKTPNNYFNDIAFFPNGRNFVTVGGGFRVDLWDLNGKLVRIIDQKANKDLRSVLLTPDGSTLIWGGDEGILFAQNLTTEKTQSLNVAVGPIRKIACSRDGKLLLVGGRNMSTVKVLETESLRVIQTSPRHHRDEVRALAFLSDGKTVLSGDTGGTILRWDLKTGTSIHNRVGHSGPLTTVALASQNGLCITGGRDRYLRAWNLRQGKEIASFACTTYPLQVRFSPDGEWLGAITDTHLMLWPWQDERIALEKTKVQMPLERTDRYLLTFSPTESHYLLAQVKKGMINIYDRNLHKPIKKILLKDDQCTALAYAPNGKTFLAGSESGQVLRGEATTGKLWSLKGRHDHAVIHIAFHPGEKLFATVSSDGATWIWSSETDTVRQKLPMQPSTPTAVAFSPDGKWLTRSDDTGKISFWQVSHPGIVEPFGELQIDSSIVDLAFSAESRHLILAQSNGTAMLLRLWAKE